MMIITQKYVNNHTIMYTQEKKIQLSIITVYIISVSSLQECLTSICIQSCVKFGGITFPTDQILITQNNSSHLTTIILQA